MTVSVTMKWAFCHEYIQCIRVCALSRQPVSWQWSVQMCFTVLACNLLGSKHNIMMARLFNIALLLFTRVLEM